MRKRNEDFTLKELINVFLPRLWIIVVVSLVFGATMAVYSKFIKKDTFTSTTRIHVIKATSLDFAVSDVEFASSYLETYVEVLTIPDFLEDVLVIFESRHADFEKNEGDYEKKGWDKLKPGDIMGCISSSTKQDILTISVTTGDPNLSHGIAECIKDVFANGKFLAYEQDVVKVKPLQLPHPQGANSRKVLLNTLIGLVVGAVLSMVAIFVVNMFDVIIHDKKKIEDNFDIPILGVIPRFISDEGRIKK